MPLLEEVKIAAEDQVERAEHELAEAARPPVPPEPILQGPQELARLSPQPDRLEAMRTAASPLFDAARPLLTALAGMAARLDVAQADAVYLRLKEEVALFQSVCNDAGIRYEVILGASYSLCTALDAAAADARVVGSNADDVETHPEATRSLAVHFHGDSNGGAKVFRLVGWLVNKPHAHLDLLELMLVILRLGFEGLYRYAAKGRRELENMQYRLHSMVSTCRTGGSPICLRTGERSNALSTSLAAPQFLHNR
ncbi:type IVB secretion system protein IcmH/DotU [Variovorax sp. S2]|uniref:type IVB secretion system protein IcmH/DotU n=1 Tax=Variovorax sp. S12S4 TaxID=3029170 RepID=UPI00215C1510|nr:type IVB secretion system protein IcmH/DotU [Variovorax sp. S12S4]MCR8957936.1 type IVB secretion system protein IcmH/DotU [Variovorax sp. S12S4]